MNIQIATTFASLAIGAILVLEIIFPKRKTKVTKAR